MRIGIDLDNTILRYQSLFWRLARAREWIKADCAADKAAVKAQLKAVAGSEEEGEQRWQILQSLAYGREIDGAELFPGFRSFVTLARENGAHLEIISHKSQKSHKDPEVDLWYWALHTLESRGFFQTCEAGGLGFSRDEIWFCETRKLKVDRVAAQDLDFFIDDLKAVFDEPIWPAKVCPLLIHRQGDGKPLHVRDWFAMCGVFLCMFQTDWGIPEAIKPLSGGGNNRMLHFRMRRGDLVFKYGLEEEASDRTRREWLFLNMLARKGFAHVPQAPAYDRSGVLLSFVPGRRPTQGDPQHIDRVIEFLTDLHEIGPMDPSNLQPAAHARLKPQLFVTHLQQRLERLREGCTASNNPLHREILAFLDGPFAKQHREALLEFHQTLDRNKIDPQAVLPPDLHFPSPSDFGLHNCLEQDNGHLYFLDFEYAGWDDVVKLMCDITCHVGAGFSEQDRTRITHALQCLREPMDPQLSIRFKACLPLVRLEWVAIVLSVVHPEEAARKLFANPTQTLEELLSMRLNRARQMLRPLHEFGGIP